MTYLKVDYFFITVGPEVSYSCYTKAMIIHFNLLKNGTLFSFTVTFNVVGNL